MATETDDSRYSEVLETALALASERGIAGASLRELARRLGISQPSLYHYFSSKAELIRRLAEKGAEHLVDSMQLHELLRLEPTQIPEHVKQHILKLYEGERHVRYVRFLFAVAIEAPEHRATIERVFSERVLSRPSDELARHFEGANSPLPPSLVLALQMLSRTIALALMEDRILFGLSAPSERTLAFIEFAADATSKLIAAQNPPREP